MDVHLGGQGGKRKYSAFGKRHQEKSYSQRNFMGKKNHPKDSSAKKQYTIW